MKKNNAYYLLIYLIANYSYSFSQKADDFLFEAGVTSLVPKVSYFNLDHEKIFADDIAFHLKVMPVQTFSYKVSAGYQVKLFKDHSQKINLAFFLTYKRIEEKNKQQGEYEGGYQNVQFYGSRELDSKLNVVSFSTGFNYALKDNLRPHEWLIEALASLNANILTHIHKTEKPIYALNYFSSGNETYTNKSRSLYPSADLKVVRLFKIKEIFLGPFFGYNFNFRAIKKTGNYTDAFDNAVYNLQFYHFLEVGIRIKI